MADGVYRIQELWVCTNEVAYTGKVDLSLDNFFSLEVLVPPIKRLFREERFHYKKYLTNGSISLTSVHLPNSHGKTNWPTA